MGGGAGGGLGGPALCLEGGLLHGRLPITSSTGAPSRGTEPLESGLEGAFSLTFRALAGISTPSLDADPVAFSWGELGFFTAPWPCCGLAESSAASCTFGAGPSTGNTAESLALWGAVLCSPCTPSVWSPYTTRHRPVMLLATLLLPGGRQCLFLRWRRWQRNGMAGVGPRERSIGVLLAGMAKEAGFWHALILLFFLACGARSAPAMTGLGDAVGGPAGGAWLFSPRSGVSFSVLFVQAWLGTILAITRPNPTALSHHWLTQARVLGEYLRRFLDSRGPLERSSDSPGRSSWSGYGGGPETAGGGQRPVVWVLERALRGRRWLAALMGLCFFHLHPALRLPPGRAHGGVPHLSLSPLVRSPARGRSSVRLTDFRFPRLAFLARPLYCSSRRSPFSDAHLVPLPRLGRRAGNW